MPPVLYSEQSFAGIWMLIGARFYLILIKINEQEGQKMTVQDKLGEEKCNR